MSEKTYLVLNYCSSPLAVTTKYDNIMILGGTPEEPSSYPLTLDEIRFINNNSKVFKNGLLFFEPDDEKMLYAELRIQNYEDILRNEDIEDIMLHPTAESMRKIFAIEDLSYFDRIYGVYMGLRNAGYSISADTRDTMELRYRELQAKKRKTGIKIQSPTESQPEMTSAATEEIDALKKQLEQMQKMMAQMMATKPEPESGDEAEPMAKPVEKKSSAPKKTSKK